MKQLVYSAKLAVLLAACSALTAQAQGQAPAARPQVAIIDLSYVFKNYTKFNELTESMKREVETADQALKAKQEQLKALGQQAEGMQLGTPDRNRLEEQFTKMQADIQVEIANQRKEFLRKEAQIYYSIYQEVQNAITAYCERNGIVLVMRFNGDAPDPNNPQEVMQDLNKAVVYYNRAIDITFPIKQALEATRPNGSASPAANATAPRATQPRTGANPTGVPRRQ